MYSSVMNTVGVDLRKKPKDLSASESERGHGKVGGLYTTLLQSDTVKSYGRAKSGTRSESGQGILTVKTGRCVV